MYKRVVNILFLLTVIAVTLVSCEGEEDVTVDQRSAIVSYLEGKNAEYRVTPDSAFVHVAGNSITPIPTEQIETGDSVTFNFEVSIFKTAPGAPYFTNKKWAVSRIPDYAQIDTTVWNFNPIKIKLGEGTILKGLESALPTCRAGDSLEVFLNSNLAYGDEDLGYVPANSALMYVLTILNVKK